MVKSVSTILAGINGYGGFYLNHLLESGENIGVHLTAVADPNAAACSRLAELRERGIGIFRTLRDFFRENKVELVIIAAPVQYHLPMAELAVENGAHVLCEKPLAPTLEQADDFRALEKRSSGIVAIGYQWSFSKAIQDFKSDILKGRMGAPKRLRTLVLWPRSASYYRRNKWAGRIKTDNGQWVFDSPAHNAASHYLHNMLYLLGSDIDLSAWPEELEGVLYRAKEIENFDSAAFRIIADNQAELFFYTSHATRRKRGPVFDLEFNNCKVHYDQEEGSTIKCFFKDGSKVEYGDPDVEPLNKLTAVVRAIKEKGGVVCGVEAAAPQVKCISMLQQRCSISPAPPDRIETAIQENGDKITWIKGLAEEFEQAWEEWRLPDPYLSY